jgi:REase_AHJR-like
VSRPVQERHDAVVRTLAERYRQEGYTVLLDQLVTARSGQGVRADLLATRDSYTVLVEVRMVTSARTEPVLKQLSEVAQEKGWKFVIVIANEASIEEIEIPTADDIRRVLREVEVVAKDSSTSAVLLAWSAFEAAARLYFTKSGQRLTRPSSPRALIQQLAARGAVDVDEERALSRFADQRNHLAHGVWSMERPVNVAQIVQIAERLIETDPLHAAG